MVGPVAERDPVYLLFREDASESRSWILVAYVPENSMVKDRMLYSSTRETLKRDLGSTWFAGEYFADGKGELDFGVMKAHLAKDGGSVAPLTREEEMHNAVLKEERSQGAGENKGLGAIPFQFTPDAETKLDELVKESINTVQLFVDPKSEQVQLKDATTVDVAGLGATLTSNEPRFLVHRFKHGDAAHIVLFYYCKDEAPVRQKMIASTCKSTLVNNLEAKGLKVAKSIEIRDGSEITQADLVDQLGLGSSGAGADGDASETPAAVEKPTFTKPSRPGRGSARLVRKPKA